METGCLAFVLHAHLPFVRHPEHDYSLEENWFYQAITETYLPLLLAIDRLLEEGVDFRLTFSLTPTLASMLDDELLQSRYLARLQLLIELAEKEVVRTRSLPKFHALARMYLSLLQNVQHAFQERYGRNLLTAFQRLQNVGKVEIVASCATHGYLPLLSVSEAAVRTQVRVGVEHYRRIFGQQPRGFWLPECGFYTGVDQLLREQGVDYTILETHGITRAVPRTHHGVYAPVACDSGLVAFGRDPESSRQVWSAVEGYPGDPDYREFYRDIGYDLDLDYIGPYIHPDGIRIDTGLKYYRITGEGTDKQPYVPEWAERKAEMHAEHFLEQRIRQVRGVAPHMDREPIVVAPYDAELFGHWWFEGPRWLEHVLRKAARQNTVRLVTLSEYLRDHPHPPAAEPSPSSWGHKGFSEVWLNPENHWIYPQLHASADSLEKLAATQHTRSGLAERALNQATRELLLAQSSDWAFMINYGTSDLYATRRVKHHLQRFERLRNQIAAGTVEESWVAQIESQDNIFLNQDVAADFVHAAERQAPEEPVPVMPRPASAGARLRIVMVTPEAVPFAKTGGLADMVSSLSLQLERAGHEVTLILPAHASALRGSVPLEELPGRLPVSMMVGAPSPAILRGKIGDAVTVYLVHAEGVFDRPQLYGTTDGDYPDNAERFVFFCRAALDVMHRLDPPHILHAHDWQAAMAVAFLKAQPWAYPKLEGTRTVFTVHNAGYQGIFDASKWPLLHLNPEFFTPRYLEFYGRINFLKAGLMFADAITTVSPSYAREVQSVEQGFGLEGVFRQRAARLVGILNGADYEVWNPTNDPYVVGPYSAEDLAGKRACKADLQRNFGLPENPDVPLLGMVARLVDQKGCDILANALPELFQRDVQLVVLGTGDRYYQELFRALPARYPGKAGVRIAFAEELAHKIEAGADMFLMPSRYEPGGLNQLYSLHYGTIPIVRAIGGLQDSVREFDPKSSTGTGFLFESYDGAALLAAVDRSLAAFAEKTAWSSLMQNAMHADFGWAAAMDRYLELYREILEEADRVSGS